jgi:hypothetical protein
LLSVLSLTTAVFAQGKVTIKFPAKTDAGIFEDKTWPTKEPSKVLKFNGDTTDFTLTGEKLFVIDYTKGNVATKAAADLKSGTWEIKDGAYTALYKVVVEVSTPKGLATGATVELSDASGKREEILDSSSKGRASFFFIQPGDVKAVVTYRADGKMADPVKQSFTVKMERDQVEPVLKVALPGGDAIAAETPAATTEKGKEEADKKSEGKDSDDKDKVVQGVNPLGNILITLIGLGFVAGIAYFILKYMRENPDKVKDTMTKLGADVPKIPGADPDPVAPIPAPVKPQPQPQIILDGVIPTIPPVPPSNVAKPPAPVAPTGIPILMASDGSAFQIPDGETVVGREFGNGLVVPDDTVSRRHASIHKNGTSVEVIDHGSTNGTWVNGFKVVGNQPLKQGDAVRFGNIEYKYQG